jgi:hypothetical protein
MLYSLILKKIKMIKKRPKLDLQTLVKNKTEFEKLPILLQKKIFQFFRDSNNLNRKNQKIEGLQKKIKEELPLKRKLSKRITENFNFISNELSIGVPSIYLTPEFTGKSYRIDIDWKGSRKKFTIGKTIPDIKKLCEKYKPNSTDKLTSTNFKDIVRKSLSKVIEQKLSEIGRSKFERLHKIKIDSNTLEITFIDPKDELEKKRDKSTKKPSSIMVKTQHSTFGGGGGKVQLGGGSVTKNKNKLGQVTNIDDTPKWIKDKSERSKVFLKPMSRKRK